MGDGFTTKVVVDVERLFLVLVVIPEGNLRLFLLYTICESAVRRRGCRTSQLEILATHAGGSRQSPAT